MLISQNCITFAKKLREQHNNLLTMKQENTESKIKKILINKYFITGFIFAVIFIFIGDHSLIQYIKRAKQIRDTKRQIETTNHAIKEAEQTLRTLQHPDSLEQYARETYLMHTSQEDVYLVE